MRPNAPLHVLQRRAPNVEAELLEESLIGMRFVVGGSAVGIVERELHVSPDPRAEVEDATPQHACPSGRSVEDVVGRRGAVIAAYRGRPGLIDARFLTERI